MLHRKDFMTWDQKEKMEKVKVRTHAACLKACGVARPGKTAKDRYMKSH